MHKFVVGEYLLLTNFQLYYTQYVHGDITLLEKLFYGNNRQWLFKKACD
jgi:hypothetical protein